MAKNSITLKLVKRENVFCLCSEIPDNVAIFSSDILRDQEEQLLISTLARCSFNCVGQIHLGSLCLSERYLCPILVLSMVTVMNGSFENPSQQCTPFTKDDSACVKVIKAMCLSILMSSSLLGNSAIIAIVLRNKHMQTTTNYLIVNMAVSDFMLSAFAVPRELTEIFIGYRRWLINGPAGIAMCKLVYFVQDISTAVSIQSIVVITVDRYAGVVTPFRKPVITSKRLKLVIPVIWILSMGLHSPYFYTARHIQLNNTGICFFTWEPAHDNLQAQQIYYSTVSATLIAIPLAIITVLYSLLFRVMRRQNFFWRTVASFRLRRRKEDTKIIYKILAIIVLFVACILPIDILGFLYFFAWLDKVPCGMDHVSFAAKFIFYSNASLNPCIYFLLNERYRQGLQNILKYRVSVPRQSVKNGCR